MIDIILTISSVLIFAPWTVKTYMTPWSRTSWSRQLLLSCLTLELIAVLYIPSVMYIGVGVLMVTFCIYLWVERPPLRVTPLFVMALLYLLYYALSLLWSAAPKKGLHFLLDNGLVLVSTSAISCFITLKKEEYVQILQQFCYASCMFVVLGFLSWIITLCELNMSFWNWPILQKEIIHGASSYDWIFRFLGGKEGYTHPSYNLLPIFVSIPIGAWLQKHNISQGILWYFLLFGAIVLTLLSQSRMGIIYSGVVLVCNLIYLLPSKRQKIILATCLCVCGLIAFGLSKNFWITYGSDSTRNLLETYTLRYVKEKPFTGSGAGALNPIEVCRTINETYWPGVGHVDVNQNIANWKPKARMLPHNQWLADWAHAGIFAALITTLLYLSIMLRCIKYKNYWGIIFMIVFSIFSYLEPPLYIGKGFYLFCMMGCLVFALANTYILYEEIKKSEVN